MPTVQYDLGNPSVEVSSSWVTLVCDEITEINQHTKYSDLCLENYRQSTLKLFCLLFGCETHT